MAHNRTEEAAILLTNIFASIAAATGLAGLNLSDWDLRFAIVLKGLSIISSIFVIAVNWDKAIKQFKKWFGK